MGRLGRVLLRCASPARRRTDPAAGALTGRADPALRGRSARQLRPAKAAEVQCAHSVVSRTPSASCAPRLALARLQWRPPPPVIAARPPNEAPAQPDARRDAVPRRVRCSLAFQIAWRTPLRVRARGDSAERQLHSRRFGYGGFWRQLELA